MHLREELGIELAPRLRIEERPPGGTRRPAARESRSGRPVRPAPDGCGAIVAATSADRRGTAAPCDRGAGAPAAFETVPATSARRDVRVTLMPARLRVPSICRCRSAASFASTIAESIVQSSGSPAPRSGTVPGITLRAVNCPSAPSANSTIPISQSVGDEIGYRLSRTPERLTVGGQRIERDLSGHRHAALHAQLDAVRAASVDVEVDAAPHLAARDAGLTARRAVRLDDVRTGHDAGKRERSVTAHVAKPDADAVDRQAGVDQLQTALRNRPFAARDPAGDRHRLDDLQPDIDARHFFARADANGAGGRAERRARVVDRHVAE